MDNGRKMKWQDLRGRRRTLRPGRKFKRMARGEVRRRRRRRWGVEEVEGEEAAAGEVMTEERDKVQECGEKQQGPCSC